MLETMQYCNGIHCTVYYDSGLMPSFALRSLYVPQFMLTMVWLVPQTLVQVHLYDILNTLRQCSH